VKKFKIILASIGCSMFLALFVSALYSKDWNGAIIQFTLLCLYICLVFQHMTIDTLEKSNERLRDFILKYPR
jgi:hypothetical protein